jgi:tRNA-dihydrouridine synthase B
MGCPAPKVVKNHEGCALMTDLPLAEKIIRAVARSVKIPVTVKMRKGWDNNSINAVELARIAEYSGVAAVTVHGRTRNQYYTGKADWEIIAKVKDAVSIPVVGNGDITEPSDAVAMISQTKCDGIMIGRGAMGNPWLFLRTVNLMKNGSLIPDPVSHEKIQIALRHLEMVEIFKGELRAVREMRKHIAWYLKGLRDSAKVRELINKAMTIKDIKKILESYSG